MFAMLVAVLCHVLPGGVGNCVEEIVTDSKLSKHHLSKLHGPGPDRHCQLDVRASDLPCELDARALQMRAGSLQAAP
jgi:hypothetical protein